MNIHEKTPAAAKMIYSDILIFICKCAGVVFSRTFNNYKVVYQRKTVISYVN